MYAWQFIANVCLAVYFNVCLAVYSENKHGWWMWGWPYWIPCEGVVCSYS